MEKLMSLKGSIRDCRVQLGTEIAGPTWRETIPDYRIVLDKFKDQTVFVEGCEFAWHNNQKIYVKDFVFDSDNEYIWKDCAGRGITVYSANPIILCEEEDKWLLDGIYKHLVFDNPSREEIYRDLIRASSGSTHPFLRLTKDSVKRIRGLMKEDEYAGMMAEYSLRKADHLMKSEPAQNDNERRSNLTKLHDLAFAYLLTDNQKYLSKVLEIFEDSRTAEEWNYDHFLDASKILLSLAQAYDWLYDVLSEETRAQFRNEILYKGLLPAEYLLDNDVWWYFRPPYYNNWTAHCASGIIIGALAIGGEVCPELSAKLIHKCLVSIIDSFLLGSLPDGGWEEGHWYWGFGLLPLTEALSCLESYFGRTYGIEKYTLMQKSVYFYTHLCGTQRGFNFADSMRMGKTIAAFFWWGRALGDKNMAGLRLCDIIDHARRNDMQLLSVPSVDDLIYYEPEFCNYDVLNSADRYFEMDAFYRCAEVATFRTSWDDKDAMFFGIKGGWGAANHAHADCGTFVLDDLGERWAWDLSGESYSLPGYFDTFGDRYRYHRIMPAGHNTLVFGNPAENCQDIYKRALIREISMGADQSSAVVDMSDVYAKYTRKCLREVVFDKRARTVTITDDIVCEGSQSFVWQMYTKADIDVIDSRHVILSMNGKMLNVHLEGEGEFYEDTACPPKDAYLFELQDKNEGFRRLAVRFDQVNRIRYSVTLG